jgi:type I restriction enzyme, S subunit
MSESIRIKANWVRRPLSDIVEFHPGYAFPDAEQGRRDESLPFYKVGDMSRPENSRVLTVAGNYVSELVARRYGWKPCPPGSVAFAKVGAALLMNRRRIIDRRSLIDNNMLAVAGRGDVHEGYLYYALQSVDFSKFVQDGVVPSVNQSQIGDVRVLIPPLAEQRTIAEILDTADEAIRSTERLITKLEQAKQGLLHDLLTRGIDESGSLRAPATLVNTPLGRSPNSWVVHRVEELLEGRPKNGYSPKEVDQWTGTLMLGLGCLTQSGFRPLQLKNAPSRDAGLKRALLTDGDLLISRANTRELVGLVGRFQELGIPCTYPDLMMRLRPNHRVLPEYLEIALRAPSTRRHIQAAASGTSGSMVKISSSVLCNLLIAVPEIAEQRRIIRVLNGVAVRIGAEERRLVKLRLVKKGLADDLLTGRVRVGALA